MVTIVRDPAQLLAGVVDPELPFLSIVDLGLVRRVEVDGVKVTVTITPTYSGCPALETIRSDIETTLLAQGFEPEIVTALAPPWTTSNLTSRARELLAANGFAPPQPDEQVACPRCSASPARMVSRFGSTACKALMVCTSCGEPFDLFKELG